MKPLPDERPVPLLGRRILGALTREVHPARRRWGEPPDLYFVHTVGTHVHLRGLGLPGALWAQGETSHVLAWIADAAESVMPVWAALVPAGLCGVAVRCEAWALRGFPAAEVAALSIAEVRAHPQAVRERFMCAVDRNGTTYGIEASGTGEVLDSRYHPRGHPTHFATGTLPDALDRILCATLRLRLPPRSVDPPLETPTERNGNT